jgi:hypothetical protein
MQRLDITVVSPAAAQGQRTGGDGALQRRVADEPSVPDLLAQLLLGDDALAMGEQIDEQAEHFRPQADRLSRPVQDIALGIQDTVAEGIVHGRSPRPGPAHRRRHDGSEAALRLFQAAYDRAITTRVDRETLVGLDHDWRTDGICDAEGHGPGAARTSEEAVFGPF